MLRALIFDCDGVIADTEPLHLSMLQRVLGEEGIDLSKEQYYREYLALDDRDCFLKAHLSIGKQLTETRISELIERKASYLKPSLENHLRIFPGVIDLIKRAAQAYPLAIASGALRREVELIVEHAGVASCFKVIVAAEDITLGKPHPEPFLKACALLNKRGTIALEPNECLVIEDSIHGIEAAHLAGMSCLAVTNSYPREKLNLADSIVETLEGLALGDLEAIVSR